MNDRALSATATADDTAARRRIAVALDALDRAAPVLVGALVVGYFILFTLMSIY